LKKKNKQDLSNNKTILIFIQVNKNSIKIKKPSVAQQLKSKEINKIRR